MKLQESAQKLDLLKLSLELRTEELPPESKQRKELEQEINSIPAALYQTKSSRNSSNIINTYATMPKPVALTGKLYYHCKGVGKFWKSVLIVDFVWFSYVIYLVSQLLV